MMVGTTLIIHNHEKEITAKMFITSHCENHLKSN